MVTGKVGPSRNKSRILKVNTEFDAKGNDVGDKLSIYANSKERIREVLKHSKLSTIA